MTPRCCRTLEDRKIRNHGYIYTLQAQLRLDNCRSHLQVFKALTYRQVDISVVEHFAIGAVGHSFDYRAGQIRPNFARHRCDVSSKQYCPDAEPQRWTPPRVTRFGVRARVY